MTDYDDDDMDRLEIEGIEVRHHNFASLPLRTKSVCRLIGELIPGCAISAKETNESIDERWQVQSAILVILGITAEEQEIALDLLGYQFHHNEKER